MFDIEELLRDQAYRIQVQYPMEFALDLMEVMHTDDIRAFRRHPGCRTIRFSYDSSSNPSYTEPNQPQTQPTHQHPNQTQSQPAHQTHQPPN